MHGRKNFFYPLAYSPEKLALKICDINLQMASWVYMLSAICSTS